ncbi:Nuclear pore complex protein NUP85 [Hibiscus syriacus]|uniref:Nuclear pore complex protein Nup85 n=1 Tax=Hibiscus syriacus TaxID=106335 RepID=A0A6A3CZL3_HIBSY|nr:Nuclear pore complex protein NUP85 [Hibiscus syriacus]
MPSSSSDYGGGALVLISPESQVAVVYPLHHGLKYPISRLSISWSRGNSLRVSKGEDPTSLKAAWELLEMFYAENPSHSWLPERLVDWLWKMIPIPKYWEVISSFISISCWLRCCACMDLIDLINSAIVRLTENGLVVAVVVLISKMPRMRLDQEAGKLGECFKAEPDFVKAWEKWRGQINKLDSSAFWFQCAHQQIREGLRSMLQIMLGNANSLCSATFHWIELYISHLLYIRPFTVKSIQLKPMASAHRLMGLIIGILWENTKVVLAECSKEFGPCDHAEMLLHEERQNMGGISIEELHRLIYAQVLSSHPLTWQIAPIYLISCMKHGMVLLQILLSKQPVQDNQLTLKHRDLPPLRTPQHNFKYYEVKDSHCPSLDCWSTPLEAWSERLWSVLASASSG